MFTQCDVCGDRLEDVQNVAGDFRLCPPCRLKYDEKAKERTRNIDAEVKPLTKDEAGPTLLDIAAPRVIATGGPTPKTIADVAREVARSSIKAGFGPVSEPYRRQTIWHGEHVKLKGGGFTTQIRMMQEHVSRFEELRLDCPYKNSDWTYLTSMHIGQAQVFRGVFPIRLFSPPPEEPEEARVDLLRHMAGMVPRTCAPGMELLLEFRNDHPSPVDLIVNVRWLQVI